MSGFGLGVAASHSSSSPTLPLLWLLLRQHWSQAAWALPLTLNYIIDEERGGLPHGNSSSSISVLPAHVRRIHTSVPLQNKNTARFAICVKRFRVPTDIILHAVPEHQRQSLRLCKRIRIKLFRSYIMLWKLNPVNCRTSSLSCFSELQIFTWIRQIHFI